MSRLLFVLTILLAQSAFAISENVRRWIIDETMSNAAAFRDPMPVQIEHFEIPLSAIEMRSSLSSDKEAIRSLIFTKNGQRYIRWIINPEDTKWHRELEKELGEKGLDTKRYKYFRGYRSASRSYFIEDPKSGYEFFAKVSTNKTGGEWRSKQQDWEDAKEVKMAADAIEKAVAAYKPKYFKPLKENLVFGFVQADQAMVIRSIAEIRNNGFYYLPGFSAMHENMGRIIAQKNGSNDPAAFWNEHYNKVLARAMAEYNIMTGLSFDSPHSQNFLVELDARLRPTGRIVFRDFGDAYISVELRNALGGNLAKVWTKSLRREGYLPSTIGLMHGNKFPSWLPQDVYDQWGKEYHEIYDLQVSRLTGLALSEVKASVSDVHRSGEYFYHRMSMTTPAWKKFLDSVRATNGFRGRVQVRCYSLFAG